MAKGKSKNRSGRDTSVIANLRLHRPTVTPASMVFSDIEDRRYFHPEQGFRPALSFSGKPHRIVVADPVRTVAPGKSIKVYKQTRGTLTFAAPKKVLICHRRKTRREVLFAKRLGRGGRGRRNWYSSISCR